MNAPLKKIAVIITVYNRREKTLECLRHLFAQDNCGLQITVYLTDDGSTDGTGDEVRRLFPQVVVSRGNGSLFWTGGMNLSWELAMKSDDYDGYLWLNDDTVPIDGIWHRFIEAHNYCIATYGKGGIYVGSTLDKQGEKHTYGGSRSVSRWKGKFQMVKPNGEFQKCDIAHGNITLISKDVADKLGCLYKGYAHGYGDYDYSLAATRKGFPVLILKDYVGYCDNDHKHLRDILISKKSLKERIKYLYAPTGMDLSSRLLYQWRFYPHYYLLTLTAYWVRAIFPQIIGKDTI